MHRTAWSKHNSSVPSDRIRPSHPPSPSKQQSARSRDRSANSDAAPKSRDVRRLEALVGGLRNTTDGARDPKGGCFCKARIHDLSPYTPICKSCGLVLCAVNLPFYACPSCAAPLMAPSAREALALQLSDQIDATLAREEAARLQALEDARKAAGAFPSLSASASSTSLPDSNLRAANQTHKVLSLTGTAKHKKVVVSSYSASPAPSPSHTPKVQEEDEPEPERIPPPPREVEYARRQPDPVRPWMNVRPGAPSYTYVPSKPAKDKGKARPSKGKGHGAQK